MKEPRYIISGGGTGGHIFPAIAIANKLKAMHPNAQFLFIGANGKMEMEKVPQAGYEIVGLDIVGIQRKLTLKNLMFPIKLFKSIGKARKLIKEFKPDVVIGVGGFASGPTLKAATQLGIPTLIQEQNSFPGITNKWLAKKVNKICVAYEGMEKFFPSEKIILTGNPVREDVVKIDDKKAQAEKHFDLDPSKDTLLVIGGSLGAKSINEGIEKYIEQLINQNIQIIWQTGKPFFEQAEKLVKDKNINNVFVSAFIYEMDLAYAAADFVISRAGAIAVAELCLVKKPSIFIPYPYAAEDHQTKNAEALTKHDAALLIKDSDVKKELLKTVSNLIQNKSITQSLKDNIAKLGFENATETITEEVEKLRLN